MLLAWRHKMNLMQGFFWKHLDLLEKSQDPKIKKIYKAQSPSNINGVHSE
jgi:Spy/CpxP family protein refolding chaperone